MKYVVAVSGGVDSMVLLDMLVREQKHELVVAHFDHGIRDDSYEDALFVERAARKHGLLFETKREELGATASEELARSRRYAFLKEVSKKHKAAIVTAHHLDDLVETIIINFIRGTGWRGLAVFDALSSGVQRPLLDMEKAQIILYATENGISWREDSTNSSERYLRNKIRPQAQLLSTNQKRQLLSLAAAQKDIKHAIAREVVKLFDETRGKYSRYTITMMPTQSALECLRYLTQGRLTISQLERLLLAVKVARPNSVFEAGSGITVHFGTRHFSL